MERQWKKKIWEPGKSFFGGKCTLFGADCKMPRKRKSIGSVIQFFNRLLSIKSRDDD